MDWCDYYIILLLLSLHSLYIPIYVLCLCHAFLMSSCLVCMPLQIYLVMKMLKCTCTPNQTKYPTLMALKLSVILFPLPNDDTVWRYLMIAYDGVGYASHFCSLLRREKLCMFVIPHAKKKTFSHDMCSTYTQLSLQRQTVTQSRFITVGNYNSIFCL